MGIQIWGIGFVLALKEVNSLMTGGIIRRVLNNA
jgi:hypothetical protein